MSDTPQAVPSAQAAPSAGRVVAIDALRGFDLFWIVGGREALVALIVLLAATLPTPWVNALRENIDWKFLNGQMKHMAWWGFSAWDMIMPLFLFIVGAAMPFSFGRRLEQGRSLPSLYFRVLRRVLVLWLLGMIAQGHLLEIDTWLPQLADPQHAGNYQLHFFSNTLQAIAVGYLVASIALIHLPKYGQVGLTVLLLAGYWALMQFLAAPGQEVGDIQPKSNFAWHVDTLVLGRFIDGTDYTWVLSGMGFAATTLLGVFAGHLLRSAWSEPVKVVWLLLLGALTLGLGLVWHGHFEFGPYVVDLEGPWQCLINKHLWSSSMVLYAAGWSCFLLAAFYLVIDVLKLRRWAVLFTVIGSNAIFAYVITRVYGTLAQSGAGYRKVANQLVPFQQIAENLLGGLARYFGAIGSPWSDIGRAMIPLAAFALLWSLLYYMYRKGTYLRV